MSITSVGASFGYIDPASIGGAGRSVPQSDDTATAAPPAKPDDTSTGNGAAGGPNPQASGQSSTPKFAAVTGAALIQVQAQATGNASLKPPAGL